MDFATPHMQRRTAWKHVATVDEVQPKTFIHSFIHSFSKIKFDFYYDGLSCHVSVMLRYFMSRHTRPFHVMLHMSSPVMLRDVIIQVMSCHVNSCQ